MEEIRSAHNRVPAPPTIHVGAYLTGGLKELYHRISRGEAIDNTDADVHTNEKGQFRPGHDGPVVMAQRYYITEMLTTGGQSAVLVYAEDLFQQNRVVVIKVLHTSYFTIGAQEADCLRRLAVADPLHISHTVKLLNTFIYGGHFCMVFESLCPQPITDIFDDLQLPNCTHLQKVKKLTLQLLVVLGFLRQQNTIHADLKPENILLKHDNDLNSVQVIDFGNSIQHVHKEVSLYYQDFDVQTLLYRAPEVMFGIPFGTEIDMWSLGCILGELYLGRPLFFGKSKTEILTSITSVLGPLPKEIFQRGKFSQELEQFTASVEQEDATSKLMQCLHGSRDYAFANFLAQIFRYDPDERLSPSAAAQHPFLAQELCVSFLLPPAVKKQPASSILLNSATYKNSVKISSEVKRQNPSTYDLLVMGTESRYESSYCETRVAEVQPYKRERDTFHESYRYSEGHRSSRSSSPSVTSPQHQNGISMASRRDTVLPSLSQTHCFENKHWNDSGFYDKSDSVKSEEKYSSFSCGRSGTPAFDLIRNLPSRSHASYRGHERSRSPLEKRKKQNLTCVPFNKQTLKVVYQEPKSDHGQRSKCRDTLYPRRSVQKKENYSEDQKTQVWNSLHSHVKVLVNEGSPLIKDCKNVDDRMLEDNSGVMEKYEQTTGAFVPSENMRTSQSVPQTYSCETPTEEWPSMPGGVSHSQQSSAFSAYNQNPLQLADRNKNNSGDEFIDAVNYFRPSPVEIRSRKDTEKTQDCDMLETQGSELSCRYEDCSAGVTVSSISQMDINTVDHSGKLTNSVKSFPQDFFTQKISTFSVSPNKDDVGVYGLATLQTVSGGQHSLGNSNSGREVLCRSEHKESEMGGWKGKVIRKEQKSESKSYPPLLCRESKFTADIDLTPLSRRRSNTVEWKVPLEVKSRGTKPETSSRKKLILEQAEIESAQNRTTLLISDGEDLSGDEAKRLMLETTVQCQEVEERVTERKSDVCFVRRDMTNRRNRNIFTNRASIDPTTSNNQNVNFMKTRDLWGEIPAVNIEVDCKGESNIDNRKQIKCETQAFTDTDREGTSAQNTKMTMQQRTLEKTTCEDSRGKKISDVQSRDHERNFCEEVTVQWYDAGDGFSVSDEGYGNIRIHQRGFHRIIRSRSSDGDDDEVVEAVRSKEGSSDRDEVSVLSSPVCLQLDHPVKESPCADELCTVRSVEQPTETSALLNLKVHPSDCTDSAKKVLTNLEYTKSPEDKQYSPCMRPNTPQDDSMWSKETDVCLGNVLFCPESRLFKHGCDSELGKGETDQHTTDTIRSMSAAQIVTEEDMVIEDEGTEQIPTADFIPCAWNKPQDTYINTCYDNKSDERETCSRFTSKSDCSKLGEDASSQPTPDSVDSSSSSSDDDDDDDVDVNSVHEMPERAIDKHFSSSSEDLTSADEAHNVEDNTEPNLMDRSDPASSPSIEHHTASEQGPCGHDLEINSEEYDDKLSPKSDVNVVSVSYSRTEASDSESESQKSKQHIVRRPHAKRQLNFAKQVQKKQFSFKTKTSAALYVNSDDRQSEQSRLQGPPKDPKTIRDPYQFVASPVKKQASGKVGVSHSLSCSAKKPKTTLSRLKKRAIVTAKGRRKSSLDLTDKAVHHRLALLAEQSSVQSSVRAKRTRKGEETYNKTNTNKSAASDYHPRDCSDSDSQDSGTFKACVQKRQKTCHSESSHCQPKRKYNVLLKSTPQKSLVTSPKTDSDVKSPARKVKKPNFLDQLILSAERITPRNQTSTPRSTKTSRQGLQSVDLDESIIFIAEKSNSKQTRTNVQGEGHPRTVGKPKSKTPKRKHIDADDEVRPCLRCPSPLLHALRGSSTRKRKSRGYPQCTWPNSWWFPKDWFHFDCV